jgi:hypothetical protein
LLKRLRGIKMLVGNSPHRKDLTMDTPNTTDQNLPNVPMTSETLRIGDTFYAQAGDADLYCEVTRVYEASLDATVLNAGTESAFGSFSRATGEGHINDQDAKIVFCGPFPDNIAHVPASAIDFAKAQMKATKQGRRKPGSKTTKKSKKKATKKARKARK